MHNFPGPNASSPALVMLAPHPKPHKPPADNARRSRPKQSHASVGTTTSPSAVGLSHLRQQRLHEDDDVSVLVRQRSTSDPGGEMKPPLPGPKPPLSPLSLLPRDGVASELARQRSRFASVSRSPKSKRKARKSVILSQVPLPSNVYVVPGSPRLPSKTRAKSPRRAPASPIFKRHVPPPLILDRITEHATTKHGGHSIATPPLSPRSAKLYSLKQIWSAAVTRSMAKKEDVETHDPSVSSPDSLSVLDLNAPGVRVSLPALDLSSARTLPRLPGARSPRLPKMTDAMSSLAALGAAGVSTGSANGSGSVPHTNTIPSSPRFRHATFVRSPASVPRMSSTRRRRQRRADDGVLPSLPARPPPSPPRGAGSVRHESSVAVPPARAHSVGNPRKASLSSFSAAGSCSSHKPAGINSPKRPHGPPPPKSDLHLRARRERTGTAQRLEAFAHAGGKRRWDVDTSASGTSARDIMKSVRRSQTTPLIPGVHYTPAAPQRGNLDTKETAEVVPPRARTSASGIRNFTCEPAQTSMSDNRSRSRARSNSDSSVQSTQSAASAQSTVSVQSNLSSISLQQPPTYSSGGGPKAPPLPAGIASARGERCSICGSKFSFAMRKKTCHSCVVAVCLHCSDLVLDKGDSVLCEAARGDDGGNSRREELVRICRRCYDRVDSRYAHIPVDSRRSLALLRSIRNFKVRSLGEPRGRQLPGCIPAPRDVSHTLAFAAAPRKPPRPVSPSVFLPPGGRGAVIARSPASAPARRDVSPPPRFAGRAQGVGARSHGRTIVRSDVVNRRGVGAKSVAVQGSSLRRTIAPANHRRPPPPPSRAPPRVRRPPRHAHASTSGAGAADTRSGKLVRARTSDASISSASARSDSWFITSESESSSECDTVSANTVSATAPSPRVRGRTRGRTHRRSASENDLVMHLTPAHRAPRKVAVSLQVDRVSPAIPGRLWRPGQQSTVSFPPCASRAQIPHTPVRRGPNSLRRPMPVAARHRPSHVSRAVCPAPHHAPHVRRAPPVSDTAKRSVHVVPGRPVHAASQRPVPAASRRPVPSSLPIAASRVPPSMLSLDDVRATCIPSHTTHAHSPNAMSPRSAAPSTRAPSSPRRFVSQSRSLLPSAARNPSVPNGGALMPPPPPRGVIQAAASNLKEAAAVASPPRSPHPFVNVPPVLPAPALHQPSPVAHVAMNSTPRMVSPRFPARHDSGTSPRSRASPPGAPRRPAPHSTTRPIARGAPPRVYNARGSHRLLPHIVSPRTGEPLTIHRAGSVPVIAFRKP